MRDLVVEFLTTWKIFRPFNLFCLCLVIDFWTLCESVLENKDAIRFIVIVLVSREINHLVR